MDAFLYVVFAIFVLLVLAWAAVRTDALLYDADPQEGSSSEPNPVA